MAITNAQQARQLYQFGGGADAGGKDSPGGGTFGGGGGDAQDSRDRGKEKSMLDAQRRADLSRLANITADDKEFEQQGFETLRVKDSNFPGFLSMGLNLLKGPRQKALDYNIDFFRNDPRTKRAREKYGLTAQGYKNYMSDRQKGTIDAAGNLLYQDDDDNDAYIFPRSGIMAEAPSDMDPESEIEEDEDLRLAFRANGGRIGYKQGSSFLESLGFTPEHSAAVADMDKNFSGSQFDYSAAATKDMVDRASSPVTAAISAAGNVLGRPAYDAVDAAKEYSKKGYQGEFSLSPTGIVDFGKNLASLGKEFVDQRPDIMMAGALKGGIESIGTKLGEGIYDAINKPANIDEEDFDVKKMMAKEAQLKKQKMQEETLKKIKEEAAAKEAAQRQATRRMAEQNRQRGRGGYQSSFGQDEGFMGGSGTAAEMGSFAYGGRAGLAEGGMPYEGGIMDLESARQMYGLGKLVKKVTRSVKKIAKSPIGKAAILAAGGYYLGGGNMGPFSKFLPTMKYGNAAGTGFGFSNILPNIFNAAKMPGLAEKAFSMGTTGKIGLGIAGVSALSGLLTKEQEEEAQLISDQTGIDIEEIRANPDKYLGRRFRAEGGSMDEPVAKKTMPLLDMGGKEMDLRAEGGFVPIGRMEKADDVPARLSKNEFVFTADAVRNAGDGNVDKGAEVMYNMMKNLESGGDVSEESQGLEGARKMFQTSQRLEEVL